MPPKERLLCVFLFLVNIKSINVIPGARPHRKHLRSASLLFILRKPAQPETLAASFFFFFFYRRQATAASAAVSHLVTITDDISCPNVL